MSSAGIDLRLAYHLLVHLDLRKLDQSTAVPSLGRDTYNDLVVPVPPESLQLRLAMQIDELFAEIDDGEAALARARSDLETWRKSLLKAAVTGDLTADWRSANPPTETGADLLARILVDRRARWQAEPRNKGKKYVEPTGPETDGLPGLPDRWTWATIEQLATAGPTNGYSPAKSVDGEGTLALKLTATTSGNIRLDQKSIKTIGETIAPGSTLFLKEDDLLFQRGNTREYVGMAAIYHGPPETYIYPDLMIRIRTSTARLTEWIWRWSVSPYGRKYLMEAAQGGAGTMPKISGQTIRAMAVPIPPDGEMKAALSLLQDTQASDFATDFSEEEVGTTLRQSVLAAAFRGELVA